MVQNLIAFASIHYQLNRLLTYNLIQQFPIQIVLSLPPLIIALTEKLSQVLQIIAVFGSFVLIGLGSNSVKYVLMVFVDMVIVFIFKFHEELSHEK